MSEYDEEQEEKDDESPKQQESINNFGSASIGQEPSAIHCLTIVGQIEGHQILHESSKTTKYEHVMPIIAAVEEDGGDDRTLSGESRLPFHQ